MSKYLKKKENIFHIKSSQSYDKKILNKKLCWIQKVFFSIDYLSVYEKKFMHFDMYFDMNLIYQLLFFIIYFYMDLLVVLLAFLIPLIQKKIKNFFSML